MLSIGKYYRSPQHMRARASRIRLYIKEYKKYNLFIDAVPLEPTAAFIFAVDVRYDPLLSILLYTASDASTYTHTVVL